MAYAPPNIQPDFFGQDVGVDSPPTEAAHYQTTGGLEVELKELQAALHHANGLLQYEVAERARLEKELQSSETRFRLVAENLDTIFWMASPDQQKLLYVSSSYEKVWGRSCSSLYANPQSFLEAIHPEDQARILQHYTHGHLSDTEYRLIQPDGTVRWMWSHCTPVRDEQGTIVYQVGVIRDITKHKAYEAQIEHLAFTDTLTGLPNRRRLYETGEVWLAAALEHDDSVALLYLDLDRFKTLNDTMGHDAGDNLLIQATARLRQAMPDQALLSRIGGDEFAVLLNHATPDQAVMVAERMLACICQPFDLLGQRVYLAGSIGIAIGPIGDLSFSTLLTRADIAMYCAKRDAKGVQVYNPSMNPMLPDQVQLETELRWALATDALQLYYQPVLDINTGQVVGVEALLRWPHPTRGTLLPDRFLPLAEEAGLMRVMDSWVLGTALSQAAVWSDAGSHLSIAINLTACSLQHLSMVTEVAELLAVTGVHPEQVILELTEHSALRDLAISRQVLAGLRDLGVRIALDDFGNGYASLSYLQQMPVDILKVDRAFTAGIGHEPRGESVVRALLSLGGSMGLTIIVEGVENTSQLSWLREAGCKWVQGYLIGKPMPPEQIVATTSRSGG